VHACAGAGVLPIDQPHIDLERPEALEQECAKARSLGFVGKLAIHPRQCAAIKKAFQPTPAQLERARRIVTAFEAAGGNVAAIDGQMIDVPMYRSAVRVVASSG
jgi:citrate lyase beta subunit